MRAAAAPSPDALAVGPWSAPAALSSCGSLGPPHALFPDDSPSHATGAGALVWNAAASCPGGSGARIAAIGAEDLPGRADAIDAGPHTPGSGGQLSAGAAPNGRIVIAGNSSGEGGAGVLVQGPAGGPFTALDGAAGDSPPQAISTGYLGDVALASSSSGATGSSLRLQIERHFAARLAPPISFAPAGLTAIGALTVAMDFRSDALLAWTQNDETYARDLPRSGLGDPLQRVGPAGAHTQIAALLSDDNRAILLWSVQRADQTSVYLAHSGTGVRFGLPRLLERFTDPDAFSPPTGAVQLVRLSSESVMAAWAGAADGRWVVRTAAIDQHGLEHIATISDRGGDALLSALAAGPAGDAVVLWTEPQGTAAGTPDRALLAARGFDAFPDRTVFGVPEQVAPPGPVRGATLALDPASDRAVAVWQGPAGSIEYSVRSADSSG